MQELKRSKGVKLNNNASSSGEFCQKTRTVQQPQPDDANPNTAESMVKTCTVPRCNIQFQLLDRLVECVGDWTAPARLVNPTSGRGGSVKQ
jgi:hypothetical protein